MKRFTIYVCRVCGDPNIQITAWIDANTLESLDCGVDGPYETCWCPTCEDHLPNWSEIEVAAPTHAGALADARRGFASAQSERCKKPPEGESL